MIKKGHTTDLFAQLENAFLKIDKLSQKLSNIEKKHKSEINNLKTQFKKEKDELKFEIDTLKNENQILKNDNTKLNKEVLRLKSIINKDSSNSSKPSGTNGFKKVITNSREKSDRKQGGQLNHQFHSLNEEKVQELIDKGAIVEVIEINKNETNKNKVYKTIKIIDIEVKTVIKEYRCYPNELGNYDIPNNITQNITYGNNIKALSCSLMHQFPNSTDGVKQIISSITNDGIDLSKGTLINWTNYLSDKLEPVIDNIEKELLNSYYLNQDETGIKINGENANIITSSNETHTRMWVSKNKTHEALETIGFLISYMGVIVKDGTDIYNGFGIAFAQCIAHILRYLKGVYDFVNHKYAIEMSKFLKRCIKIRNELKHKNINEFDIETYNELRNEYGNIIKCWKKEWMGSEANNPVYDEERKLLSRMEDSDKEQILYFLKDFKIPATNNQVESDQRPAKIKQKIGKFRSMVGAEQYAIIRSCINTYKKNNINVLSAFSNAFASNPVIV